MTEADALTTIIVRCPDLLRQATHALRAWRGTSPIREQTFARVILDALRQYGEEFSPEERAAMLALLPATEENEARTLNIIIRATATEKSRVQARADEAGQTMSDYIRTRIGL